MSLAVWHPEDEARIAYEPYSPSEHPGSPGQVLFSPVKRHAQWYTFASYRSNMF